MKLAAALILATCSARAQTNVVTLNSGLYSIATNIATRVTNEPPIRVEAILASPDKDNIIKRLVSEGHVCAMIDHKWWPGCGVEGCLVIHGNPMRYCMVCRKVETQIPGEWK